MEPLFNRCRSNYNYLLTIAAQSLININVDNIAVDSAVRTVARTTASDFLLAAGYDYDIVINTEFKY